MMKQLWKFLCVMGVLAASAQNANANQVVADLSLDEVAITTDFNGQNLLLFGAVAANTDMQSASENENDIIVVFTGPVQPLASRRKERVSGIWINRETVNWKNAPSFYHILSSRPVADIASDQLQADLKIGYRHLGLRAAEPLADGQNVRDWQDALYRNMTGKGLWRTEEDAVKIMRNALFRASVDLPANIVPGDYQVRILNLRDGRLVSEDMREITVQKTGISAFIYRFAHDYAIFYGLFAVFFAVASGWLASAAFRRS